MKPSKIESFFGWFNIRNTHALYLVALAITLAVCAVMNPTATTDDWLEILGTVTQIFIPCYAVVPILWKKDRLGALQMVMMTIIVLSITYLLKFTVPAARPYGGSMSFPSGHTAGAFIGVLFLGIRYGLRYFIVFLPLGLFVGLSRIYSRNHWPIDVASSILLCTIVGFCCVRQLERKK